MTGDQFLTELNDIIAPATVATMKNNTDPRNSGLDFTLSDGRRFTVKRQRIKDCANAEELRAYVQECIGS